MEIVAERELGRSVLTKRLRLKGALNKLERRATTQRRLKLTENEKQRIASIVELCCEYEKESDPEERANILKTLEEIAKNEAPSAPTQSLDDWDRELREMNESYSRISKKAEKETEKFLKKYFSFRARSGFSTQEAVANASGLSRSYIAVIESGDHYPQQKTFQKLAKAFHTDVSDLM